jgi:hypothetical protein
MKMSIGGLVTNGTRGCWILAAFTFTTVDEPAATLNTVFIRLKLTSAVNPIRSPTCRYRMTGFNLAQTPLLLVCHCKQWNIDIRSTKAVATSSTKSIKSLEQNNCLCNDKCWIFKAINHHKNLLIFIFQTSPMFFFDVLRNFAQLFGL